MPFQSVLQASQYSTVTNMSYFANTTFDEYMVTILKSQVDFIDMYNEPTSSFSGTSVDQLQRFGRNSSDGDIILSLKVQLSN